MSDRPTERHELTVEADDLGRLPSVYVPIKEFGEIDEKLRFSITLPTELVLGLVDPLPKRVGSHRRVGAILRPRVIPGAKPADQLVRELQVLEAMNMSRDHVFAGERLIVTVRRYFYAMRDRQGHGLALESVRFDTNRAIEGAGS